MSESSVTDAASLSNGSPFASQAGGYDLHSDLARLCLPSEFRDRTRKLAWVNSICFLFLIIGLVGLRAPKVIVKPLSKPQENIPVVFTPPNEQKVEPEVKQEEPEPQDTPLETPQVLTVVAAADAPVAFAVPVPGAVAIAPEARLASAPPRTTQAQTRPRQFDPNGMAGGSYPDPLYPGIAQRNQYQGTVIIEFTVDASGTLTSAKVQKTSGYTVLDDAALEVVRHRWRFPPTAEGWYFKPFIFRMP